MKCWNNIMRCRFEREMIKIVEMKWKEMFDRLLMKCSSEVLKQNLSDTTNNSQMNKQILFQCMSLYKLAFRFLF